MKAFINAELEKLLSKSEKNEDKFGLALAKAASSVTSGSYVTVSSKDLEKTQTCEIAKAKTARR